ncbi:MAG TPA: Zn-ribbon domain-containing OB-fold protein [Candidatus Binatus sp.]|nr:Zn-ribbon domain-containing OB-fold protein [Candidatus Binatus sp.]
MGFEEFGEHGYVSQAKVTPILDYLKKGQLAATKCQSCNSLYFPPRMDCPKCRGTKFDWVQLNPDCKLITFTEVFFAPPDFQAKTPYLLGLAELTDGPRVFAPIDGSIDRKLLKPGALLTLRPKRTEKNASYLLEKRK